MTENQKKVVVRVEHLTKSFKIPLEASSGVKQRLINIFKGRKGYRIFTPLSDVSFEIEKGDFFGIVGRNGSGKSTLLKSIAGIYTIGSGKLSVDGTLVPFIELGVGFNIELTGRENVYLNGALLGFSNKEMDEMYDEIVDFAELHDFMEERIKNYSSGMQVRLAFSIAIKAEGDILLLDEVLAVGDAAFQQKCFNYFEQLKKDKKTIIFVTHDMAAVQRFCNRAMIIENGLIKKIGKPSDIADIYTKDNIKKPVPEHEVESDIIKSEYTLSLRTKSNNGYVELSFQCKGISDDHSTYVGFTLFKNGMNIGEINSLEKTMDKGRISYNLKVEQLNPGLYEISAALFEKETRSLIAVLNERRMVTIKGYDPVRGSGLRLQDNWRTQ